MGSFFGGTYRFSGRNKCGFIYVSVDDMVMELEVIQKRQGWESSALAVRRRGITQQLARRRSTA
jgi:hypothetical protein